MESTDRDDAPDRVELLLDITKGGRADRGGTHDRSTMNPCAGFRKQSAAEWAEWRTLPVVQLLQLSNPPPPLL